MYLAIVLFAIFFGCFAMLFNNGLWTNTLLLVNVLTAGLIAMNYFEPLASFFDKQEPSLTYVWDFVAIWLVFGVAMTVLRVATDFASMHKVKFFMPVEKAGGVLMAIWVSWVLLCFTTATLHTAPLSRSFLGGAFRPEPSSRLLFGTDPDYVWLGWTHRESRGSLSRFGEAHEFDKNGTFVLRYGERRQAFSNQLTLTKPKAGAAGPQP
jgi:hypothetical protein